MKLSGRRGAQILLRSNPARAGKADLSALDLVAQGAERALYSLRLHFERPQGKI